MNAKLIAETAATKYPLVGCMFQDYVIQEQRKAFTDAMELILSTHVPLSEVESILNTVCHPDHASETIGYIRPLVGKPATDSYSTKK